MKNLSIVIPTYNRSLILNESLKNYLILFQNIHNFLYEIVILDNSSNDETEDVFNSYKSSILNLKYFRNVVNIGGGANILRGFEYANGEYIWILPDDCYPSKHFINKYFSLKTSSIKLFYLGHTNEMHNDYHNVSDLIFSSFISESSWLPRIIYKRDLAIEYLSGAYSYLYYSYPHLYIIYNLLLNSISKKDICFLDKSFSSIDIDKNKFQSYSWIRGSAIKFALAVSKIISNKKERKYVIKSHKIKSNLNREVFNLVFWELNYLKVGDFLILIYYYGFFNLISLLQYFVFILMSRRFRIKFFYFFKKSTNKQTTSFFNFYYCYLRRYANSRAEF